jgi:phage tail-like protein
MSSADTQPLLSLLPAIYREDEFVGRYIAAFEQVLLGLEQQIDDISKLFHPLTTQAEFLPWLSSWVAFTLRADLNEDQQRRFLARVISLYRFRGTKENLRELLSIFTVGLPPTTIIENTVPPPPEGGSPAHHFTVLVRLAKDKPDFLHRQGAIARALVDMEKPAHTHYHMVIEFPTMQIGITSQIGIDTLLGSLDSSTNA